MLDVQPMPTPPGWPVVDVAVFGALARLAQRYELLILHWVRSGVHTYLVHADTTIFRYRTQDTVTMTGSAMKRATTREPTYQLQGIHQHCERNI